MKPYFFIFLFLTLKVFGQAPLGINFYLDNKHVSKTAKDFYTGNFRATDGSKTFSIIDSLKTENNLTRPFYIFLVSKIMNKADGALSESLGASCKKFIESNPDFLIDFFYSKSKLIENDFLDNWTKHIAGEFMITCEGKEKECLKKSLQKALKQVKPDNKSKLTTFYHKIEIYCHK